MEFPPRRMVHADTRDRAARWSTDLAAPAPLPAAGADCAPHASPPGRAPRATPAGLDRRHDAHLRRGKRGCGRICRRAHRGRHQARRPRRHHVRQPGRASAHDIGLRLAWRHRGSHQCRVARRTAGTHPEQLRCTTDGDRARARASRCATRPRPLSARSPVAGRRRKWRNYRRLPLPALPATAKGPAAAPGRAGRYVRDPLHLRHDRPVQRCVLPARAIFLVGRLYRRPHRCARRRRADDHAAHVPHQRLERFLPGAAEWSNIWSSSRASRRPAS